MSIQLYFMLVKQASEYFKSMTLYFNNFKNIPEGCNPGRFSEYVKLAAFKHSNDLEKILPGLFFWDMDRSYT